MKDVLLLTKADHLNYRALCAVVEGRLVRRTTQREFGRDILTPARKLALLQKQAYRCAECGCDFVVRKGRCAEATSEHVIPFRYGGEANTHNIILVCQPCNHKRDENFSLKQIERHFGPVDLSLLNYVPIVQLTLPTEQDLLRLRARRL